jgi:YgiT-type zinc finger domain-containing protein
MTDAASLRPDAFTLVEEAVRVWRRAHPGATLTELEHELDTRLRAARAALLADVASDVVPGVERCPTCGGPLVARGTRRRTLITDGDAAVLLTRPYATCPVCGTGLFPP